METATYTPAPASLDDVELPKGISELVETMAAHNHDVWAESKIKKGYSFGYVTSDEAMTHCDLIPYEDLTEEKKQYDRDTSLGALKLILSLGYTITKG